MILYKAGAFRSSTMLEDLLHMLNPCPGAVTLRSRCSSLDHLALGQALLCSWLFKPLLVLANTRALEMVVSAGCNAWRSARFKRADIRNAFPALPFARGSNQTKRTNRPITSLATTGCRYDFVRDACRVSAGQPEQPQISGPFERIPCTRRSFRQTLSLQTI